MASNRLQYQQDTARARTRGKLKITKPDGTVQLVNKKDADAAAKRTLRSGYS